MKIEEYNMETKFKKARTSSQLVWLIGTISVGVYLLYAVSGRENKGQETDENENMLESASQADIYINDVPLCDMNTRRAKIYDVCRRHEGFMFGLTQEQKDELYKQILVFDKLNLLYCPIPEAGSTLFKALLVNLSGESVPARPAGVLDSNSPSYGVKSLDQYSTEKRREILSDVNYQRLIVVRNPIDRMLSFYADKGRGLSNKTNGTSEEKDPHNLEEYLNYLADTDADLGDPRKRTYVDLCQPCYVHYNIIFKLETVDRDKERLSRLLSRNNAGIDASKIAHLHINHTPRKVSTPSTVIQELKNVSKHVLQSIYRHSRYEDDFKMFGYLCENVTPKCEDKRNHNCC